MDYHESIGNSNDRVVAGIVYFCVIMIIHGRNFTSRKCEGNTAEEFEQEKSYVVKLKKQGNSHILVTG